MRFILLAALLAAAPVFAHGGGSDDDWYPGDDDSSATDEVPPPPDDSVAYAPPDQGPTYDDFRRDDQLRWYGEWIDTPAYGLVWRPTRVDDDWQPYRYGRWAWTTAGWAWVSDEPFGWAVYHYGRWAWSPSGWLWIPGRMWAPAWVAWRWGDRYAGWCPMGPRGMVYEQPVQWVFVERRHFLEPVRHYVVPRRERWVTPIPTGRGPRAGPPVQAVERATGRTIRPLAVVDAPAPRAAQAGSGSVGFYRPRTAPVAVPRQWGEARPGSRAGSPQPGPRAGSPQSGPRAGTPEQGPRAGSPQQGGQGPRVVTPRPNSPRATGAPPPRAQGGPKPVPKAKDKDESNSKQSVPHAKER